MTIANRIGLLCIAVMCGPLMAFGQVPESANSGFDRILERVTERDESSDAIVSVSPLSDAPDPAAKLTLSIKPAIGATKVFVVELKDAKDRNAIVESYRFKVSEKLTAEAEKLKKPRTTPKAAAKANPNPGVVFLKVPHIAQGKNMCAPTSVSMVMKFYGQDVAQERIKALANSVTKRPDFVGTYYIDIVNGLKTVGVEWRTQDYKADAVGYETAMKELIANLDAGRPVIIDTFHKPDGHTVVVNGYDSNRKVMFLVDPLIPAPGLREIPLDEFPNLWRSLTVDARGAIFTQPLRK